MFMSAHHLVYVRKKGAMLHIRWTILNIACLILLFVVSGLRAYSYDAFSAAIPSGDVGSLYGSYFTNLQTFLPCTLTGRVGLSSDTGKPATNLVGCVPYQSGNFISSVFPLSLASAVELQLSCTAGSVGNTTILEGAFGGFRASSAVDGVFIVLSDTALPPVAPYNLSCIVASVAAWNAAIAQPAAVVAGQHISGIVMDDVAVSFFGKPLTSYDEVAKTPLLWSPHESVSLLLFRTMGSEVALREFQQVVQAAYYNVASAGLTIASPSSVQYAGQMFASPPQVNASCLADGTCLPIGGVNVVGTTAPSQWATAAGSSNFSFVKTTPPGSVAIVVSSSSVGLFHDAIPAADASASGIVAALLAIDALVQSLGQVLAANHTAPQLYALFLVGEEYDRIGSSRFISETTSFACERFPSEIDSTSLVDCSFPNYRSLNFTTINVSEIQHFIQVEQVGVAAGSLWQHIASEQNNTAVQRYANSVFSNVGGVSPASTRSFPQNSPLASFMEHNGDASSYSLVSRYDSDYQNTKLFTPLDLPDDLSLGAVKLAAANIASVVAALLGQTAVNVQVNNSLADELWYCFTENFNCASLGGPSGVVAAPNYYTSVFQYGLNIQPYQALIQTQLSLTLSVFTSHALSLAATYQDSPVITFGLVNGSAWFESNWGPVGSRLAMTTSTSGYELIPLGVAVNVCVIAGLYWSYFR